MLFHFIPQQSIYLVSFFRFFFGKPTEKPGWGKKWNFMEHIRIKKARKSLIYTLLEVFGKPVCGGGEK